MDLDWPPCTVNKHARNKVSWGQNCRRLVYERRLLNVSMLLALSPRNDNIVISQPALCHRKCVIINARLERALSRKCRSLRKRKEKSQTEEQITRAATKSSGLLEAASDKMT